jgi:hypothetical protein
MPWYAIRTVYLFGVKADGTNVFEERVVCFEAESSDEAHEKAGAESDQYARDNDMEAHPEQIAYLQDGDALIDGYEVWSELYDSRQPLAAFYEARYSAYDHEPDPYPPES